MLTNSMITVLHQAGQTGALLQCSAAAWSLLLQGGNSSCLSCGSRALSNSSGGGGGKRPARSSQQHSQHSQQQQLHPAHSQQPSLLRALSSGSRLMRGAAPMSHAAALLTDFGTGSDEETAPGAAAAAARRQQPSQQQQQFKATAGPASQAHGPGAQQPPPAGGRYQGHLHAPHGRRHATTSQQQTNVDRFISEQLLSCKSLGMLRRIQIKHKATMEAEHVADTLLALQHLVRTARTRRVGAGSAGAGGAGGNRAAVAHPLAHATSLARAQPRVRGDLGRSKPRSAESDGHAEQLMAQMLGELGGAIWYQMGDMTGPDLAKVLYSWAMLDWHAEPELRADVKVSLLSAAAAADGQQQSEEQQWLAAGLWGLAKLGEPFEGQVLSVLEQHWRQLLHLWTPQQLADVAAALVAVADEQVAATAIAGREAAAGDVQTQQLLPLVSGLAQQLVQSVAHQQQHGAGEEAGELRVPLPWPESVLVRVQHALHSPALDAGSDSASSPAAAQPDDAPTPLVPVHNVPHLAWCMLQALAAVGVNVSEPEDATLCALIADLSAATKGSARAS